MAARRAQQKPQSHRAAQRQHGTFPDTDTGAI